MKNNWQTEFRKYLNKGCSDDFYVAYVSELIEKERQDEREKIKVELEKIPFDYEYGYEKCFDRVKKVIELIK